MSQSILLDQIDGRKPLTARDVAWRIPDKYRRIAERLEERVAGRRGAPESRRRFAELLARGQKTAPHRLAPEARRAMWTKRSAEALAAAAGYMTDEHGMYRRGDHLTVTGLDYIGPWQSAEAPYLDMGGQGLGIVKVQRKRIYAKSSRWSPSVAVQHYLVGRNEAGTYFAHAVPTSCETLLQAIDWIWSGHAADLVTRQGDVALIRGRGPKVPELPDGHVVQGEQVVHPTHLPFRLPGPGERIIVGRRAADRPVRQSRD